MLERLRAVARATSITRAIASPAVIASPSALTTGAASDASASASIAYGGSRSAPLRTRKRAVTGLRQTLARSLRRRAWWMSRVTRASIPAFRRYLRKRSNPGGRRVEPSGGDRVEADLGEELAQARLVDVSGHARLHPGLPQILSQEIKPWRDQG